MSIKTVEEQPCRPLILKSQIILKEREHVHSLGLATVRALGTLKQLTTLEWLA